MYIPKSFAEHDLPTWKMSQNRPAADIDGVIRGLEASGTVQNQAVAAIVRARRRNEH